MSIFHGRHKYTRKKKLFRYGEQSKQCQDTARLSTAETCTPIAICQRNCKTLTRST